MNELSEKEYYRKAKAYIDSIDEDLKADETEYRMRLEVCKSCIRLINGMCALCGCFVEIRAVIKHNTCPDQPDKWFN